MDSASFLYLFRTVAILFFVFFAITTFNFFIKKWNKKTTRVLGVITLFIFLCIMGLIVYNAQTTPYLSELKDMDEKDPMYETIKLKANRAMRQNAIFGDINMFVGITVRIVTVLLISLGIQFLWRKNKQYPKITGILIQKLLLILGIIGVIAFVIFETYRCFTIPDYRDEIPLELYSLFVAGGLFWMLLCSIVGAAALPEDYGLKGKDLES
jgi:hypothetical protein